MQSSSTEERASPRPDAEQVESPEELLDEFVEDAVDQIDGAGGPEVQPSRQTTRQRRKGRFWKRYQAGQKTRWWFASTAIPLLAATLGPLANVSSIAALVSYWRENVFIDGEIVPAFEGRTYPDPNWCYWLNAASLICGFLGNFFLLLNFTQRIRYLIALPATIVLWYLSTGFLTAVTICIQVYDPPPPPYHMYTQAFWYAVVSAVLYLICSMILMVNMLGYFLGHYPEHFALTDAQRTLILQTMIFFIWLAGGAAIFSAMEEKAGEPGWGFSDALYFCDVTILTVGFGDLYPTTDLARGLVFPYAVVGIIILGLVISSIYRFVRQLGAENIIKKHVNRTRQRTMERTRTASSAFDLYYHEHSGRPSEGVRGKAISRPMNPRVLGIPVGSMTPTMQKLKLAAAAARRGSWQESRYRFLAMREIQENTAKLKKWLAVSLSALAFGILWCVGAVVFWQAERHLHEPPMTYFRALYFCYVSLLTVGYGDMAPKSNPGRVFFVIWSLIAVPTMTILVSDMGDTVVEKFKKWSSRLADFTVLPKVGVYRMLGKKVPWLWGWVRRRQEQRRLKRGFELEDPEAAEELEGEMEDTDPEPGNGNAPTSTPRPSRPTPNRNRTRPSSSPARQTPHSTLATAALPMRFPPHPTPSALATLLARAIQRIARDIPLDKPKKYTYEEWVDFMKLLRHSYDAAAKAAEAAGDLAQQEVEEGAARLMAWDWIGDDSPLVSGVSESQWVLGKLCDALVRVERWPGREREKVESRRDPGNCGSRDVGSVEGRETGMRRRNGLGKRRAGAEDVDTLVPQDSAIGHTEKSQSDDRTLLNLSTGTGSEDLKLQPAPTVSPSSTRSRAYSI